MPNLLLILGILNLIATDGLLGDEFAALNEASQRISRSTRSTASPSPKTTNKMMTCPTNMTLYREPNSIDLFCDCSKKYAYHEKTDSCFKLFTIGPCKEGTYFVIRPGETVTRCTVNPCPRNQVLFMGSCHEFDVVGTTACGKAMFLGVTDDLFGVECHWSVDNMYLLGTGGMIDVIPYRCPLGFRKSRRGNCRKEKT